MQVIAKDIDTAYLRTLHLPLESAGDNRRLIPDSIGYAEFDITAGIIVDETQESIVHIARGCHYIPVADSARSRVVNDFRSCLRFGVQFVNLQDLTVSCKVTHENLASKTGYSASPERSCLLEAGSDGSFIFAGLPVENGDTVLAIGGASDSNIDLGGCHNGVAVPFVP